MSRRASRLPFLLAVALAVVYVVAAPHTADLAAQTARAELFRRSGDVPYWAGWYGGLPTAGYSLLSPPLLGLLGPVWLGAVTVVTTAAVARPLLAGTPRPAWGAAGLVVAATLDVLSGRTTFALGAVLALVTLLAVRRCRPGWALLAGLAAAAASPVAGALLLVVLAAVLLADPGHRGAAVTAAAGPLAGLAGLAVLSRGDGGGYQPFTRSSLVIALLTVAVVVLAVGDRVVRWAAGLEAAVLVAAYLVHTPVGSNATRLAILFSAPVVLAMARSPFPVVAGLTLLAAALPLSQLSNDLAAASHPDTSAGFVAGLRHQLAQDPALPGHRLEVVDTATHWPSTYLLAQASLARGWERQTDETRNPEFYGRRPLTATGYRRFLQGGAVGVVAVARGVPLDYGATREAALIRRGLPYLHLRWQDAHWSVYDVRRAVPLVSPPARVVRQLDTGLVLDAPAAGKYRVALRWSPYLVVAGGRVDRGSDGEVVLTLDRAGRHELHAVWRVP